jgi:hypothetical protein
VLLDKGLELADMGARGVAYHQACRQVHDVAPVLQKFGGNVFHVSAGATAATRKADDLCRLIRGIPGKAATPLSQRPKALAAAARSVPVADDNPYFFHFTRILCVFLTDTPQELF